MGHATHFLRRLERVSTPQADLALALYRDSKQVAHILMAANIPLGAERVALALEHDPDGPHVIVTRGGAFITCLAAGMGVSNCPVISRADLDRYRSHAGQVRQATEEGTLDSTFRRVIEQGPNVSREDIRLLIALYPLLSQELLETSAMYADYIQKLQQDFRPSLYRRITDKRREILRAYWQMTWCVGHLAVLHGAHVDTIISRLAPVMEDGLDGVLNILSTCPGVTLSTPVMLRGAWAMACAGARVLPFHQKLFETTRSFEPFVHATCTITALGLRHPELRGETRAILERCASPLVQMDDGKELGRHLRDFVSFCAKNLTHEIESQDARYRKVSAHNIAELSRKSLPESHPLRFERPEDVPEDLIYSLPMSMGEDVLKLDNLSGLMTLALPGLAMAEAEQLYLPQRYLPAYELPWNLKQTIKMLDNQRLIFGRHRPVRAQGKVGRNEPCPCGSGKKHKRCCGA